MTARALCLVPGLFALSLGACGATANDERGNRGSPPPTVGASATPSHEADVPTGAPTPTLTPSQYAAFLRDERAPLTPEVYETALLTLAACKVEDAWISDTCDQREDYKDVLLRDGGEDFRWSVALKHLRHAAPAVRGEAARVTTEEYERLDETPERVTSYLHALTSEKDAVVLTLALIGMERFAAKNIDVRNFALASLDHADARVRDKALEVVVARDVYASLPGAFDKIVAKAKADPDATLRATACERLGDTGDHRVVEPLRKILEDTTTPSGILEGCFKGLVHTWVKSPYPESPSKEAHDLTLKVLLATPRTDKMPPGGGIAALEWAQSEFKPHEQTGAAWFAKVKSFYAQPRLVKALESVATDENASSHARWRSIYTLWELGEHALVRTLATRLGKSGDEAGRRLSKEAADLLSEGTTQSHRRRN